MRTFIENNPYEQILTNQTMFEENLFHLVVEIMETIGPWNDLLGDNKNIFL